MEFLSLEYFFDSNKRVFYGYLLLAFLLAYVFFRTAFEKQFSKEVLWHKSAKLDYLYFLIVGIIKMLLIVPFLLGVNEVTLWMVLHFNTWFGYMQRVRISKEVLLISYTVILFVFSDLSRYWLHRLLHRVPFLWRFHRVHHAAEVLNPLTFYRVHPFENFLFGLRYAMVTGFVTAVYIYFFGAGIQAIEFMGANILVFVFSIVGANLRHSHIPFSYPRAVEKWLVSPYQHQLHHSTKYLDQNFGSFLAIWDRIFGTLVTGKKKNIVFGLPKEKVEHSILGALFNPIFKGVKL
ncbi:MAG: sterol desaturase family protein [Kiritimatiellae bacterium]|nr:sterol desaturase family protein [Kiritimatiellia bacterium]